jgi:hypothetical protein
MPKVTVVYNLPDEQPEYELHMCSSKMFSILWDFDQWLRSEIKYNDKEELQPIRDKLYNLMDEKNFNINEVA